MVKHGIVFEHVISNEHIEVDKVKNRIETQSSTIQVGQKHIRSFLEHAGFYLQFVKVFDKITRPLTNLLTKDELWNSPWSALRHLSSC